VNKTKRVALHKHRVRRAKLHARAKQRGKTTS